MTLPEIKHEFDILYNNIAAGAAPPLNAYEISVLLTKACEEIVINYYNGANQRFSSFESTEEIRRYLDSLIRESQLTLSSEESDNGFYKYNYIKPNDLLFVVREYAKSSGNGCMNGKNLMINPISHEDTNRILEDPFKGPNERKAIRLDLADDQTVYFTVYSKYPIGIYKVVYLQRPKPIILEDLFDGFSINGETDASENLNIPEILTRKVINRAVELAKVAYIGDLNATLSVNQRSQ